MDSAFPAAYHKQESLIVLYHLYVVYSADQSQFTNFDFFFCHWWKFDYKEQQRSFPSAEALSLERLNLLSDFHSPAFIPTLCQPC